MSQYEPELGQALFGQPSQEFACSDYVEAVLAMIGAEIERVTGNAGESLDPMGNSGDRFDCAVFSAHAYSWSDEAQPWNFKCGDFEVSWYKYLGRGMSANREISPDQASDILNKCLTELRRIDAERQD